MIDHARDYARRGLHVFPCFTTDNGVCSCGDAQCTSPAKHPIPRFAPQGFKNASTDEQVIRQWWAEYPDANIAIATGAVSGIVVIDIDEAHGGVTSWENLESRYGDIPDASYIATGSGGYHIYLSHPGRLVRNSASRIAMGIDVRGDGGYVIAPPSIHITGAHYEGVIDSLPDIPPWLHKGIATPTVRGTMRTAMTLPEKLVEGERNTRLMSLAGTMRRAGMDRQEITHALLCINQRRGNPPLKDEEVRRIAHSVNRYPPGESEKKTWHS